MYSLAGKPDLLARLCVRPPVLFLTSWWAGGHLTLIAGGGGVGTWRGILNPHPRHYGPGYKPLSHLYAVGHGAFSQLCPIYYGLFAIGCQKEASVLSLLTVPTVPSAPSFPLYLLVS